MTGTPSPSLPSLSASPKRKKALPDQTLGMVGIDFGTTNSVIAKSLGDQVAVAEHLLSSESNKKTQSFRSILCYWFDDDGPSRSIQVSAGPAAIEAYQLHGSDARLIQSVKSFVAAPSFTDTTIFGRRFPISDLIGDLLKGLRASSEMSLGPLGSQAVCGRPVKFVGGDADEKLGLERLRAAYQRAGFSTVKFVEEPLAAAHHYSQSVDQAELCLVADFGGGTSDFTVLQITPSGTKRKIKVLGQGGIGIAGDAFDYRIIQNVISPLLGKGTYFKGETGQRLELPVRYYTYLAQWHQLSMLKTRETLRDLREIRTYAEFPDRVAGFLYLIENELGYPLNVAVGNLKAQLSTDEEAILRFTLGPLNIDERVTRKQFDRWIAEDLAQIGIVIDQLLIDTKVQPERISRVFMTGGSSLIPAVRQLFETRFSEEKLSFGDEFLSIGAGLAMLASQA
jgi:hypothetical chaperone protein